MNAKSIFLLSAILSVSALAGIASAQTDNWVGNTGVWSDPTQWDSGVPVAGQNIVIGTGTANSTDDLSLAIGTLSLSNLADALTIADGVSLNVSGSINTAGPIQLSSAGSNTYLLVTGNVSLAGSGKIILGTAGPNYIQGASGAGTEVLTNAGSTIEGAGNIGNGLMGLVNSGTVIADGSAASLLIDVSSANFNNSGTLEAITGGNLVIQGPANSFLNYNSTTNTLTGGTYTADGGNISFPGTSSGVTTLSARVTQEASGQLLNSTTGASALADLSSITATGVLTTTATFAQPGAFSMAGALNILPKTSFSVGSLAQIKNNALTGGQWVLDSNFNITGTPANITINSATLTLSGGTFFNTENSSNAFANLSANKKTLRILNFAHFNSAGTFTNSGQMTVAKGSTLTIGGTATSYTQTGGKTILDGMLKGAAIINAGTLLGAGSITGNVSIGGSTSAIFSIGDAGKAAQVKVVGTYTQPSTGTLTTPIGGTTVATQYSQLKVTGAANLAGTLTAPLLTAFTPTVGQTFTVVSAKSVAGTFSNTTIPINSTEQFAVSYTVNSVVLTVVSID